MAKLILTFDGNVLGEFELNKEQMIIGRRPDSDIHIDNLAVSGHHAKVITILNDSFLEDMNSTNGTYVNGTLVKKHALQDGDTVSVGKHQLRYANSEQTSGEFEKTMIIRPDAVGMPEHTGSHTVSESVGKISRSIEKEERSAAASHSKVSRKPETTEALDPHGGKKVARLQVLSGANAGKELTLTKALTTIGRPGVQVAAITRRPHGFFIIHVEGDESNRPTVNGEPIGTQARHLGDHDIIQVASVKMEFFLS